MSAHERAICYAKTCLRIGESGRVYNLLKMKHQIGKIDVCGVLSTPRRRGRGQAHACILCRQSYDCQHHYFEIFANSRQVVVGKP